MHSLFPFAVRYVPALVMSASSFDARGSSEGHIVRMSALEAYIRGPATKSKCRPQICNHWTGARCRLPRKDMHFVEKRRQKLAGPLLFDSSVLPGGALGGTVNCAECQTDPLTPGHFCPCCGRQLSLQERREMETSAPAA